MARWLINLADKYTVENDSTEKVMYEFLWSLMTNIVKFDWLAKN